MALACTELLGRIWFPHPGRFVADVDHWPEPHQTWEFNGDGLRDRREPEDVSDETFNVLFLGDSFVFGSKLTARESLPARFEALMRQRHPDLDLRAINFGWVSSSPLLSLRRLKLLGRRYHPDLVFLFVDMTDFREDLRYRHMLEGTRAFRFVRRVPFLTWATEKVLARVSWLEPLHEVAYGYPSHRFFITESPPGKSRPFMGELRRNVEAIADFCRDELRVPFHVFVIPRHYQYSDRESPRSWERAYYVPLGPWAEEPFRWFDEMKREADFGIHSLLPDFQATKVFPHCLEDDPHWNHAGTVIATEAVMRICEEEGLIPPVAVARDAS